MNRTHFDAVVIGCGFSGLGAGIRLALAGQQVLILEKHFAPGGLNGYYSRSGFKFDAGLHAVTNYVAPKTKGAPLTKLCRQLRISRDDLALREQTQSRIVFPSAELTFTNNPSDFEDSIASTFPAEIDGFKKLLTEMKNFSALTYEGPALSARESIGKFIKNPLLKDMLLCPLSYYGSAKENDMDFDQFIVMFDAIFNEGFCRPATGIQPIIEMLIDKFEGLGGIRKMRAGVKKLHKDKTQITTIELHDGSKITAEKIFSSIGSRETEILCGEADKSVEEKRLGFTETISVLDRPSKDFGINDTILFFSTKDSFHYENPSELWDNRSGVICFPDNYQFEADEKTPDPAIRVTSLANYKQWKALSRQEYKAKKEECYTDLLQTACNISKLNKVEIDQSTLCIDHFTPTTIERYTGHKGGAIYGSPNKIKSGETPSKNLFLCGTDQGYLGIIGSLLSGVSMANRHGQIR